MALRAKRDCNVCQYYWAALSLSFAESLFFMDIIAWSPQVSVNIMLFTEKYCSPFRPECTLHVQGRGIQRVATEIRQ